MIIVDTSVWIDYFNGSDTSETSILDASLGNKEVAIGDLIALEILRGFRLDKDYNTAKKTPGYITTIQHAEPTTSIESRWQL